jgi:hypothetical protein
MEKFSALAFHLNFLPFFYVIKHRMLSRAEKRNIRKKKELSEEEQEEEEGKKAQGKGKGRRHRSRVGMEKKALLFSLFRLSKRIL